MGGEIGTKKRGGEGEVTMAIASNLRLDLKFLNCLLAYLLACLIDRLKHC